MEVERRRRSLPTTPHLSPSSQIPGFLDPGWGSRCSGKGFSMQAMDGVLACSAAPAITTSSPSRPTTDPTPSPSYQDKIADFEMKLMDGIPNSEYQAIVRMPSSEFCEDLSSIGDTVIISFTKEGVKFSTAGDIGTANIVCRQNKTVDKCARLLELVRRIRIYDPKTDLSRNNFRIKDAWLDNVEIDTKYDEKVQKKKDRDQEF